MTAGLGGFQETDQLPIFSKITKYQVHVNAPARIAELTHRAMTIALHERGPVQINVPRDYFYGEIDATIAPPQPLERSAGGSDSLDKAQKSRLFAYSDNHISENGVVIIKAQNHRSQARNQDEALKRFKMLMETGEITSAGLR